MGEGEPLNAVTPENHTPSQEDNTRFTAVNNTSNNGGTIVVAQQPAGLPQEWQALAAESRRSPDQVAGQPSRPSLFPQPAAVDLISPESLSAQQNTRRRTPEPQSDQQMHDPAASPQGQKRKRSLEPADVGQGPSPVDAYPQSVDSGSRIGEDMSSDHKMVGSVFGGRTPMEDNARPPQNIRPAEGSPQAGQEGGERKIRKRQFANRVKTGCITCRRRKKKCDEGKPECANCKRGGFVCEGYTNRVPWPVKQGKTAQPVSIQSRADSVPSASASPRSTTPQHLVTGQLLVTGEHHVANNVSPQQRPATFENGQSADIPSPVSRVQTWQLPPQPHQPHAAVSRRQLAPVSTGPLIPFSAGPVPSTAFGGSEHGGSEKQKMLTGQAYDPYAPQLAEERERCKKACHRFNNAFHMGVSKAEQWRLLVDVFRPGGQSEGTLGGIIDEVQIESTFTCTYGTNISIAKEVRIGSGCKIEDACPVVIKARTVIDDDVKIYTNYRSTDPRKRQGGKGPQSAKPVVIEEDCWIGANVTILPGVTIQRGAVVGPGSIVSKDVPQYTVAAGNPASVVRGLYTNGVES